MIYTTTKISKFNFLVCIAKKNLTRTQHIFLNIKLYFLRQKKYVDHEIEPFLEDISYVLSTVLVASLK